MSYTATIGLEVHAELKTKSKMFCGCKNDPHHSEPNTHTCPICLAHPGTLPVPNMEAIKKVLLFGQAVESKIATFSEFDRKNYFYPDIPKAYQISQYAFPFLEGGKLAGVDLTRVHLEEDTARSQHDKGEYSIVDFNRAGVPLMELVTEPVIHDAKTAGSFAKELQLLLRTLDISDANMEKGEMRVEANISVSENPNKLGTKVEVKNLNSFKSVVGAIEFEIKRHTQTIEAGGQIVQETRGWDEVNLKTFTQRVKETAKDYRYFPDPDLTKMSIDSSLLPEISVKLPNIKRLEYANLGLASDVIEIIISERDLDKFFEKFVTLGVNSAEAKLASNYLTSDVVSLLTSECDLALTGLAPAHFRELITMLINNEINSRTAKDLLRELFYTSDSPRTLAENRGLMQVSDEAALLAVVERVLEANPIVVAEYKAGKETVLQFLVGQGMKETKGSANPGTLQKLLVNSLKN